jgi:hypothetical protein
LFILLRYYLVMAKMRKNLTLFTWTQSSLCLLVLVQLASCTTSNKHHVDLDGIDIEMDIQRYEEAIFSAQTPEGVNQLKELDPEFFDYYLYDYRLLGDITGGKRVSDLEMKDNFLRFVGHADMQDLYREVQTKYSNFDEYEEQFEEAFSYYNYHFPNRVIPEVFTFITPFYSATVPLDSSLGLGLDMFLGQDFEPYAGLGNNFPQYRIRKMRPDYLVPIAMTSWLKSEFQNLDKKGRLLDEMVYEGKILYCLDATLPDTHDSLKIGYFKGQLEWCQQNEKNIWANFIENDLLYSTKRKKWDGTLFDAPFSKGEGVPQESSPRIGAYCGWQMVRAFMDKNPEVSLHQLMTETDSETVLSKSKYKP